MRKNERMWWIAMTGYGASDGVAKLRKKNPGASLPDMEIWGYVKLSGGKYVLTEKGKAFLRKKGR